MNMELDATRGDLPFSRAYRVEDIPVSGLNGSLILDERQRKTVGEILDAAEVKTFRFTYTLARHRQGRFRLTGKLEAHVVQECIITLDPIECSVDKDLEIDLWPLRDVEMLEKMSEEEGRTVLLDGPEPVIDGKIDIGQLAYEHLADALQEYPRKPEAEFHWTTDDTENDDPGTRKPLAGLKQLLHEKGEGSGAD